MIILVMDDNDNFRISIVRLLQSRGHTVIEASNGRDGMNVLSREPVELIITDIHMPEKDGIEFIIDLQKDKNPAASIPIIAMTGGDSRGFNYEKEALFFGAIHTLRKPFEMDELITIIDQLPCS